MEQRLDSLRKSLEKREVGLLRALSQGQMVMMSIGSAIGTGLFLGSGYAISLAGPGVALSFVLGAFISYTVGSALSELTRVIPTTGAFGNHAEVFIGRYLGFLVRYMYWFSEVFAIGANIAASSIYMSYWFPGVSPILWMIAFGLSLFVLNSLTVRTLGTAEFLLSMIKSAMIVLFIVAGSYIILRPEHFGTSSALLNDGLMPKGLLGIWLATVVAIYSFIGIEVVGVTSGEAKNPEKDAPKALRNTLVLLTLLYVGAIIIIVSMIPPNMAGLSESPFVLAFREVGIPAAASIINFVILTAAISGANTNLYLTSRMLF
nr:amino acid permease [Desulfurococcales archaeon]